MIRRGLESSSESASDTGSSSLAGCNSSASAAGEGGDGSPGGVSGFSSDSERTGDELTRARRVERAESNRARGGVRAARVAREGAAVSESALPASPDASHLRDLLI